MEKRYIEAIELLKNLPNDLPYKDSVKRVLMQAPTADVVEVRHGEWLVWENLPNTIYGRDTLFVCSECTAKFANTSKYCPYCGAKMDMEHFIEELKKKWEKHNEKTISQ